MPVWWSGVVVETAGPCGEDDVATTDVEGAGADDPPTDVDGVAVPAVSVVGEKSPAEVDGEVSTLRASPHTALRTRLVQAAALFRTMATPSWRSFR